MSDRLRNWRLFPAHHPYWSAAAALLLALAGGLLAYGARVLSFDRERAAAEKALAAYDFAQARRRLARCIELRPRDPAVRLLAAQAARRDGDLLAARDQLDRYRELVGQPTPEGTLEGAMLLAQEGRVKGVTDYLLSQVDAHHPASEQILEALARGCADLYLLDRASFWVGELLERAPKNPIGRLIRAQTTETLGDRDRVLEQMRELVAERPDYVKARSYLADMLLQSQQYEEAVGHFEDLRRRDPGELVPLLGLARCRARLGRPDQADQTRALMRQLEEQHSGDAEALLECGRFALGEGRPADAERLLRRAVELAPSADKPHTELAACLRKLGRPAEAENHLRRAREIEADLRLLEKAVEDTFHSPKDPRPRLEAAKICLRNGQGKEGERWLLGALEIAPNHRPTHEALADHYAALGDYKRAEEHRRRAGLPSTAGGTASRP